MAFVEMPGVTGLVYTPDEEPAKKKKHDCRDCYECGFCSCERCAICLRKTNRKV